MYNPSLLLKNTSKAIALSILLSSPFLVTANESTADESSDKEKESSDKKNTLVITANRTEQNINDTLAAVELITRQDIERIQPESITDLLANLPGFDFVYTGGAGQSSSLFTRGSNSDHTLVLVDGVRVGSATLGNKTFSTIPVAQIERIEVVKGPRASLWGSDAIGGVIHIFTRRLENGEYSVQATLGSDDYVSTNLSIGFGSPDIKNTVTVSFDESNSFDALNDANEFQSDSEPDDDGYQRISAAIRGDYSLSTATQLDWVFQYDQGDNSFDNPWGAGANENEYNNHLWNIRYRYTADKWLTEFSVKQNRDKSFSYDSRLQQKTGSTFETRRNQINLLTQYDYNDSVKFSGGVERYNDDISKSSVMQFDGSFAQFPASERSSEAVFISSILSVGDLIGELSARHDDIEFIDPEKTFNVSFGYKILDNVTIAASRSKGFKAPSFNDLYFPIFGNPELESEISFNTEFLLRANWDNHSLLLVSYDNDVDQLIDYNPAAFRSENISLANLKGREFTYQYKQGSLTHKVTGSFVDAVDKSIDSFTGQVKNTQLLRRAKEHYGYELVAELGDFSFFTQFNYSGKRRDNDFSTFPATPVYMKSYIAVNLGASYQASQQLSFKLKVSDFTENAKPTVVGYNVPGQQVYLTVQYRNF